MAETEKLIQDLLQRLELDKLKECREEEPQPALYVLVKSECIVELPHEIVNRLKPKIDLG
jgi:hypothetical protein